MKSIYIKSEIFFEKLVTLATFILGNSVTFILAFATVIFWISNRMFYTQDMHHMIGDLILGLTFLSLFIIQKSFNRFSASLHLKVNELVASHEQANNSVINLEQKTEAEIIELTKEYTELHEIIEEKILPD
jgi:low affinity Fe/Cu permease